MENNFKYIVYQTINIVNNKIYVGYHKTKDPKVFDGYIGNGVNINYPSTYMNPKWPFQKAVKKYGCSSFKRSVLFIFDTEEEALKKEAEIVTLDFVMRDDTYNLIKGGIISPNYYTRSNIYQFDRTGKLIKKWNDVYEIAEFLETWKQSIYSAINNKQRLHNFYWSYKDSINIDEFSSPTDKQKVYKYNKNGKCVEIYESLYQASKLNGYKKPCELSNRISEGALSKGFYYSYTLMETFIPGKNIDIKNKTIYLYNLDGSYDTSFNNIKELYNYLEISGISRIKTALFSGKPLKNKLLKLEYTETIKPYIKPNKKKAILIYKIDGTFIKECESISQACKEFSLDGSTVRKILRGCGKQTKGYTIKYKN